MRAENFGGDPHMRAGSVLLWKIRLIVLMC